MFQLSKTLILLTFVALVSLSNLFWVQSSLAAVPTTKPLTPEEEVDRAYTFRQGAGMREENFQQREVEGQDPEKMLKPYERVRDLEDKDVPETSLLEEAVGKVKELIK